uniref:Secreted protein n=1 Tax=Physcomitrium patens TaxID=3218 RepID=A0A7I3ZPR3_PHYPA
MLFFVSVLRLFLCVCCIVSFHPCYYQCRVLALPSPPPPPSCFCLSLHRIAPCSVLRACDYASQLPLSS